MAKQKVVKCTCDRCDRVWYEDEEEDRRSEAHVLFRGATAEDELQARFDLLCPPCEKPFRNYLANILKDPNAKENDTTSVSKEEETCAVDPTSPSLTQP